MSHLTSNMTENKPVLLHWVILVFLAIVWGSSFILIKEGLKVFEALQVGSLRAFIAFLVLIPFLFFKRFRDFKGGQWIAVFFVGLLGSFLPALLFSSAQTRISSSMAAILNSMTPLSTLVIGVLFFKTLFNKMKMSGVILGILGSALIVYFRNGDDPQGNSFWYALLALLAGVCYATEANIINRFLQKNSPMGITVWSFALVSPIAGLILFSTGAHEVEIATPESWKALGALLLLGIAGTALAMSFFNYLIQSTSALFASTVTYLIPFVALLWGIADGEIVSIWDWAGLLFILTGIYLTGK